MSTTTTTSEYITAAQIGAFLRVDERTVCRWADAGVMPPGIRVGNRIRRWRKDDIYEWLRQREQGEGAGNG